MYTNNKLAKSIRLALMFSGASLALTGVASAQDTSAAEQDEADKAQERIQVTGSRIKRSDLEGDLPVTVIDRDTIDMSGDMSISDLLRDTSFNSAGSSRPESGSSAQGVSTVNMRGLGASRTLVLIDGRRLTMSPSTGSSQDMNSIPIGAVERIEILTDGASAIYGSDAIGGVINVITRKDYNGAQVTLGQGSVSVPNDGGDREQGSVLFGSSSSETQLLGGISWNKREIVYERDFPWVTPGSSSSANNWQSLDNPNNHWGMSDKIDEETGELIPNKPPLIGIPGGCNDPNFSESIISGQPRCQYNFNATNANEASSQNESLFLKATHQLNNDWSIFANANISETESFGRYAPAPDRNGKYPGLDEVPVDSYNNPTNPNAWFYDPNNPNAVAFDYDLVGPNVPVEIRHRFAAMGNRDRTVTNNNKDFVVGFNGFIGQQEVEFGWRRARNNSTQIGNGYLAANTAWTNVIDFNPGYCADGSFDPANCRFGYDLQNPSSNPEEVLSAGVVTTSRISDFNIDEYFANTSFDVMDTDAGMIAAFVGFEHRKEDYADKYDSQSEAGLVGGSAGNSAGGGRTVNAAFFEVLVPVTHDFELNFAGRYDRYSDFGGAFAPKASFRWQLADGLVWRGSWGEGFRAPSLDILTQKTSYSASSVNDAATCVILAGDPEESCQVDSYFKANPDLQPEDSTQISTGLSYDITDDFNVTVDYYSIEIDDRIRQFSAQYLIDAELAGDPVPDGLSVVRDNTGAITEVIAGYGNDGSFETSGLDIKATARFDFGSAGSLMSKLQLSHTFDFSVDGGRNMIEDIGRPRQRATWSNAYNIGAFNLGYSLNMIGSTAEETIDGEQLGHVGSYITHDVQVNYSTPWESRLTVGVQNLFEKVPALVDFGGRDYNFELYDGYGRVMYVRFQQNF